MSNSTLAAVMGAIPAVIDINSSDNKVFESDSMQTPANPSHMFVDVAARVPRNQHGLPAQAVELASPWRPGFILNESDMVAFVDPAVAPGSTRPMRESVVRGQVNQSNDMQRMHVQHHNALTQQFVNLYKWQATLDDLTRFIIDNDLHLNNFNYDQVESVFANITEGLKSSNKEKEMEHLDLPQSQSLSGTGRTGLDVYVKLQDRKFQPRGTPEEESEQGLGDLTSLLGSRTTRTESSAAGSKSASGSDGARSQEGDGTPWPASPRRPCAVPDLEELDKERQESQRMEFELESTPKGGHTPVAPQSRGQVGAWEGNPGSAPAAASPLQPQLSLRDWSQQPALTEDVHMTDLPIGSPDASTICKLERPAHRLFPALPSQDNSPSTGVAPAPPKRARSPAGYGRGGQRRKSG